MKSNVTPVKPFHGDLWNCDRATLATATRAIVEQRGLVLAQVFHLTTGLAVTCKVLVPHEFNESRHETIPCEEIKRWVFAEIARRKEVSNG